MAILTGWYKPTVFNVLLLLFSFICCEIRYVLKNVFIVYIVSASKVDVLSIYLVSYMEGNRKQIFLYLSALVLLIRIWISFTFSQLVAMNFRFWLWAGKIRTDPKDCWGMYDVSLWNNKIISDNATLKPRWGQAKRKAFHDYLSNDKNSNIVKQQWPNISLPANTSECYFS